MEIVDPRNIQISNSLRKTLNFIDRGIEELNSKNLSTKQRQKILDALMVPHIRSSLGIEDIRASARQTKEVLDFYSSKIKSSKILKEIKLKSNDYFLCSFHREENVDDPKNLQKIINIMNSITEKYSKTIIVSTHPRTQARLEKANKIDNSLIKYMKPFGFSDYIHLQLNAVCVLSDSGTITEESSILNFSALNIREVNERPEGFEEGAVMMTSLDEESVLNCLNIIKDQGRDDTRSLNIVQDYDVSNVSDKVIRIISSYINFVNKKVWKK